MIHKNPTGARLARNTLISVILILGSLLSAFAPAAVDARAAVQAQGPRQALTAADGPELNDPRELEAFLDSVIAAQLEEQHIAGATVAVVKDGRLFLTKGYGYADVEAVISVDPEKTLFRVGSIGKLFTWTAVMQLVERGKLDLDTDVNQYLDFTIPAAFSEPVTLKHLMTHTAGFEDAAFGFASVSPQGLVPLRTWLVDNLPARAWAPGEVVAYSNYGTALAGYIVERVSGVAYEEYVERNIFAPLDMLHSTTRQPLPAALAPDLAQGYKYINASFQAQGFAYLKPVPAGSFSATATDMARFMIAHLQQGSACRADCAGGEARILRAETAQQMQSRLWAADEDFNGMAHGFMELSRNGVRVIGHSGNIPSFHSMLALLPAENIGLFISYNSEESRGSEHEVVDAFMERYFPDPAGEVSALSLNAGKSSERMAGLYQPVRHAYSKGGKILSMFASFPVQAGQDGGLIIDLGDGPQKFVETAPLHYEAVESDLRLVFRENPAGDIAYLYINKLPYMTMTSRKIAWYENISMNLLLLAGCAALFLLVLIVEPLRLLAGWIRRKSRRPQPGQARLARVIIAALAILSLLMLFGLYWQIVENYAGIAMGQRDLLTVLGGLSILIVALAGGTLFLSVRAWRRGWWGVMGRIYYSLISAAALVFVSFLTLWNQIGWQWW